jgi:PAS domain S-box-containing protein
VESLPTNAQKGEPPDPKMSRSSEKFDLDSYQPLPSLWSMSLPFLILFLGILVEIVTEILDRGSLLPFDGEFPLDAVSLAILSVGFLVVIWTHEPITSHRVRRALLLGAGFLLFSQVLDTTNELAVLRGSALLGGDHLLNYILLNTFRLSGILIALFAGLLGIGDLLNLHRSSQTNLSEVLDSERRFREIFEHSMIGMYRTTPDGRILLANDAMVRMVGLENLEQLKTRNLEHGSYMSPESRNRFKELIEGDGEVVGLEDVWKKEDGSELHVRESARCVRNDRGEVLFYEGTVEDITERKKIEEAYHQIVDHSAQGLSIVQDGRIVFANRALCEMNGYVLEEMLSMSVEEVRNTIHPEDQPLVWERHKKRLEGEQLVDHYEVRGVRKDGSLHWIEMHPSRIEYLGKPAIQTALIDITQRKIAEEALRETREINDTVFENASDALYIVDLNTSQIVDCNPAGVRFFEAESKHQVIGRRGFEMRARTPTQEELDELYVGVEQGRPYSAEMEYVTLKGNHVWASLLCNRLPVRNQRLILIRIADITERKRNEDERRELEAQVQHAQKLESLGVLAGGIAHDFNNLLMGVLGNAGLALMDLPQASPVRESVLEIETAGQRAAELCRQLLAYSGRGKFDNKPLSLSALVSEMGRLLEVSVTKKAAVRYELAQDLPPVEADPTQIRQVIMNLITNASEALEDNEGTITLRTGLRYCDSEDLRGAVLNEQLPEGDYVFVEVADTGCGMDAETLAKIFDPFFTTKFSGRGLGMAAVIGIVRGHRGTIRVQSEKGKGTVFTVLFPPSQKVVGEDLAPLPTSAIPRVEGAALVIDDEESVRNLGKTLLQRVGFTVTAAEDGRAGLDLFLENPRAWRMVLLDLTMPRMSGVEVFKQIVAHRPDLPVLLSSGYNEEDIEKDLFQLGRVSFLQKPYSPQALFSKILEMLCESRTSPPEQAPGPLLADSPRGDLSQTGMR